MTTATKSLIFHTNGQIDPKSWELMGISAKESNNPIGMFGTGLKYALAVLLREGHEVQIFCNDKQWNFGLNEINFRGKEFQQITCNGKDLPFTTEYGKKWKTEGAYRELVSNTMDEGGIWFIGNPMENGTSIVVTGSKILKAHANHDKMFIGDRQPISESEDLRIYEGNGNVFYRGVKVKELENAHYDYEMLCEMDLTEDRTIANEYTLRYRIGKSICSDVKNTKILEYLVVAKGFEQYFDYDNPWSEEFTETVTKLWSTRPTDLNPNIAAIYKRKNPTAGFEQLEMIDDEEAMVERAKEFLLLAGYPVNARIKKVKCDNQNIVAYYHDGDIHLTQKAFDKGCFEMVATLFEEQCHANGFDDYSLSFQQYLINEVIGQAKRRLKFAL